MAAAAPGGADPVAAAFARLDAALADAAPKRAAKAVDESAWQWAGVGWAARRGGTAAGSGAPRRSLAAARRRGRSRPVPGDARNAGTAAVARDAARDAARAAANRRPRPTPAPLQS